LILIGFKFIVVMYKLEILSTFFYILCSIHHTLDTKVVVKDVITWVNNIVSISIYQRVLYNEMHSQKAFQLF
jgi:hypothetical protein